MSDCRVPMPAHERPQGHGTLELRIDFEGDNEPWTYPLALDGREVAGVHVGGARYERVDGERMAGLESLVRDMHSLLIHAYAIWPGECEHCHAAPLDMAQLEEFGERMAGLGIEAR